MKAVQRPRRTSATTTQAGDHWVLVPHASGEVTVVNESGYRIMQQCDGYNTVDEIARGLIEDTGTGLETAASDVGTFIARLELAGLLVCDPDDVA